MVSEKKAVYIDNSQSEPVEEELTLRVPPPVKGFDISAKFTCKSKSGEIIMDPTSKYRFVWYRSRKYYLCSSNHCINKSSSQKSVSEMKYQCLTCLQYGNERYSYFCCPECLAKGWKEHCLQIESHSHHVQNSQNHSHIHGSFGAKAPLRSIHHRRRAGRPANEAAPQSAPSSRGMGPRIDGHVSSLFIIFFVIFLAITTSERTMQGTFFAAASRTCPTNRFLVSIRSPSQSVFPLFPFPFPDKSVPLTANRKKNKDERL